MTKLTRYKSFDDLKSSGNNSVKKTVIDDLKEKADLEKFIEVLRAHSSVIKANNPKNNADE